MQPVTLKNWFWLASVSCGVGFGSSFLISRNLQQSALAGLGTIPAVAASLKIQSRQRKEERNSNRQAELTSSLANLERREKLAQEQLQLAQSSPHQIDLQVQELRNKQSQLAQIEAKRQFAIDSVQQSELKLQRIWEEINQQSARKDQLASRVENLQTQLRSLRSEISEREICRLEIEQHISRLIDRQNQLSTEVDELDRSIQEKQALLDNLDLDLGTKTKLQLEIDSLLLQRREHQDSLDELERVIGRTGASISELNTTFTSRQRQLAIIINELTDIEVRRQSTIDSVRQSDLELADIRDEISQQSVSKEQLAARVSDLQNQLKILSSEILERSTIRTEIEQQISRLVDKQNQLSTAVDDLDRSIQCKQALRQDIDLDLEKERILEIEVSSLQRKKQDCQVSLDQLERVLDSRQGQLDGITDELAEIEARRQSAINSAEQLESAAQRLQARITQYSETREKLIRGIAIVQDQSRSLQSQITEREAYRTEVERQIARLEEELNLNISPLAGRDRDSIENTIESPALWEAHFQDDSHLPILRHIDRHGIITESEIRNILQNPYLAGQFPRKIGEYNRNEHLFFRIGVEQSDSGSRYFKKSREDGNLVLLIPVDEPPSDSPPVAIVEAETNCPKTEPVIFELEEQETIDFTSVDEPQSEFEPDLETHLNIEDSSSSCDHQSWNRVCDQCGGSPIPGEYRCYRCSY